MIKVFISGSMRIKRLDNNVLSRINNILEKHYSIVVGDADGVDSSVQEYLKQQGAKSVFVYCTGSRPRNNIGNWETNNVSTTSKQEQEHISQPKIWRWQVIAITD